MHNISTIFFQAEGIIIPSLYEATINILKNKINKKLLKKTRNEIYNLVHCLKLGMIDVDLFRKGIFKISKETISEGEFFDYFLNVRRSDRKLMQIMDKLRENYDLYLISQYPREWFEYLLNHFNDVKLFKNINVIYSTEGNLQKLFPDIFYLMRNFTGKSMEDCILVDVKADYLSNALRMGMNAVVYVDSFRLQREFVLRKMLENSIY